MSVWSFFFYFIDKQKEPWIKICKKKTFPRSWCCWKNSFIPSYQWKTTVLPVAARVGLWVNFQPGSVWMCVNLRWRKSRLVRRLLTQPDERAEHAALSDLRVIRRLSRKELLVKSRQLGTVTAKQIWSKCVSWPHGKHWFECCVVVV